MIFPYFFIFFSPFVSCHFNLISFSLAIHSESVRLSFSLLSVSLFVSCAQPISKEIAFEFAHKNNFYLTAFNRCVTQRSEKKTDSLSLMHNQSG